ncbi:unnamed protein product, partial [Symbiodinium sp. CCMP2456]
MAVSYSESASVFEARVKGSGLAAADGEKLLAKIKNLKQLAFISSYAPGQQDESPLMTELEGILSRKPEVAEKACFRALFHESYAVVTSEMKQRIEQTDDSSARRLTQPERAERFEKQRLKLSGVSIRGMTEPSEFLIDLCVSCYEHNELQYIAWERCTSREQELNTDKRRDTRFSVDAATGRLKIESKGEEEKANTSSEVFVMQALQRRSLALDQANIAEYATMQLWSDKLLRARLDEPPPGFVRPPWSQVVAADKAFFRELRDATRGGIQPGPTGARPVDACVEKVAVMHDVACLLQPVHAPATREKDDSAPRPRPGPYTTEPTKGKGKGKKGQYTPRMPLQLIQWGCVPTTKKGAPYCYGHQLGTCNLPGDGHASHERQTGEVFEVGLPKEIPLLHAGVAADGSRMDSQPLESDEESLGRDGGSQSVELALSPRARELLNIFDTLPGDEPQSDLRSEVRKSFSAGMYTKGGVSGVKRSNRDHPEPVRKFCELIRDVWPQFSFTSFLVSENSELGWHRDSQNAHALNLLIPLTFFRGGGILLEDASAPLVRAAGESRHARRLSLAAGPLAFNA